MARTVIAGGQELNLLGEELKPGQKAPEFTLINNQLQEVKLGSFKDSVVILSVVPSLDTPVCTLQTRRFNKEAADLPGVKFLTVSRDLPFAQARWIKDSGADKIIALSDYKNTSFAADYGLLIKEWFLLTRAVYVIDKEGIVKFGNFVADVATEPDYNAVLDAAKKIMQ